MMTHNSPPPPVPVRSRPHRWLLAGSGVVLVGIGALGVILPGLPTTIFLIGASWCFARSCPWLEERLIRVPFFRPFLGYLDRSAPMPRRAVITTLIVMWAFVLFSASITAFGATPRPVIAALILALGAVGTFFVVRLGMRRDDGFDPKTDTAG
jgi:uncharacterized membrane protein YbaN (DUF454 family)